MTNWYVITGGPSSGKTTTVNLLKERGYATTIEDARHYIDLQRLGGRTVAEIRARQAEFQSNVLAIELEQEARLDPQETVFLDRAIPDSLAYYRFLRLDPEQSLLDALRRVDYRKVFILDLLPMVNDYARTEDVEAQQRIHELITEVYESLPFPVVKVPPLEPSARVDYILARL
ncbi:ATPase [Sinomonas cyclohexanicum]|uniref:ATPase n=1 Tax=Sinomonas cyclohexanicum TaxID=322009 RepID=A0ABN6FM18_SINCY|nr:ATP-binding protein [Corynebacterium cyclohexanicum]BCT77882.1 ATPase [Corynebacterium cyclohexanicum]